MKSGLFLSAALAPLVSAFADTSPLFLYSTQDLPHNIHLEKFHSLATGNEFLDVVKSTVSQCTSEAYILVLQPGIHESDLRDPRSAPQIRKFAETNRFVSVLDSVGFVDINELEVYVKERCQAHTVTVDASTSSFNTFEENSTAQVIKLDFPVLPAHAEARRRGQIQNDNFLSALISMLPTTKYTVVYISTPVGDPRLLVHENEQPVQHESIAHQQSILERDVSGSAKTDDDEYAGGVLTRYQFVTPVIVWSAILVILLFYVAYVGIGALSAIQVSYGSFEKDALANENKKAK